MMPELSSTDTVYLVLGFLVPGMIATFVRAQFITGRMASHTDAALSYLVLSIIYYATTFPLVEYVMSIQEPGRWKAAAWFALVFVGPAIFGLLLGLWVKMEWGRRILRQLWLNPVHVVPSSWDWKLGNMRGSWVLVTLKDHEKLAGFCGTRSFMSSDPAERDVYIEKVFNIDDMNVWHPTEKSVLICAGEISTIEFWPVKEPHR